MGKERPGAHPDGDQIELFQSEPEPGLFDENRKRTPAAEVDMTPEDLAEEKAHYDELAAQEAEELRLRRLAELREGDNTNVPAEGMWGTGDGKKDAA